MAHEFKREATQKLRGWASNTLQNVLGPADTILEQQWPNLSKDERHQLSSLLQKSSMDLPISHEEADSARSLKSKIERNAEILQLDSIIEKYHLFTLISQEMPSARSDAWDIIGAAVLLTTEVEIDDYYVLDALRILSTFSKEERKPVVQEALPLIRLCNERDASDILKYIREIPENDRAEVVRLSNPFLFGLEYWRDMEMILRQVHSLPKQEREEIISLSLPLLRRAIPYEVVEGLKALLEVPAEERDDLVKQVQPLLGEDARQEVGKLIGFLRGFSKEERSDLIALASSLLQGINESETIIGIIDAVQQLIADQEEDREDAEAIIELAGPYMISMSEEPLAFLHNIGRIPKDQRAAILREAMPLLEDISIDEEAKAVLLRLFLHFPSSEWPDILEEAPLIEGFLIDEHPERVMISVIRSLMLLPASLKEKIRDGRSAVLLKLMMYLPSDHVETVISLVLAGAPQQVNTGVWDYLKYAISEVEGLREPLFNHLLTLLEPGEDLTQDPEQEDWIIVLASDLARSQELLGLRDDELLFQRAVEILSLRNQGEEVGAADPFKLYTRLLKSAKEPTPKVDQPEMDDQYVVSLTPLQSMEIDLSGMREFTYDELKDLILTMRRRVHSLDPLDPSHQSRRAKEERELVMSSFDELCRNFLGSDLGPSFAAEEYFKNLLAPSHGKPCPLDKAFFCASLRYIVSKSSDVTPGAWLSDQELTLLKMSISIQGCPGGKSEGVKLYYGMLEPQDRYPLKGSGKALGVGLPTEAIRVQSVIMDFIRNDIMKAISEDTPMVREMAESDNYSQLSHMSLYIKNLLSPHIGLPHDIKFDIYSRYATDRLVDKPLSEMLRIFYQHYSPEELIRRLQGYYNRNDPNTLFSGADALVDTVKSELKALWGIQTSAEFMERMFDTDYDEKYDLKEDGAFALLLAAGFLEEVQPHDPLCSEPDETVYEF